MSEKKEKSEQKKEERKRPPQKVFSLVGVHSRLAFHSIMERCAKTLGLNYIRAVDPAAAKKAFSDESAIACVVEFQIRNPIGLDICRFARDHNLYPILLADMVRQQEVLASIRAGAQDILVLPLDEYTLLLKLRRMLSRSSRGAEVAQQTQLAKIDFGDKKTPEERAQVIVRKADQILALPHAAGKLIAICNNPEAQISEMALPIQSDAALTTMLLKRANSAALGGSQKIKNVTDAIVRIGVKEVKNLAVAISVFTLFDKQEKNFGFNRQLYWVHSLATGVMAKILSERRGHPDPDAFLIGLLHDLGKIIFDDYLNEEFKKVVDAAATQNRRINEVEQQVFGMNHTLMGSKVAENWKLPDTVYEPIRNHHNLSFIFSKDREKSSLQQEATTTPAQGENAQQTKDEGEKKVSPREKSHIRDLTMIACLANSLIKAMGIGHSGDFFLDDIPDVVWEDFFKQQDNFSEIVSQLLKELNSFVDILEIRDRASLFPKKIEVREGTVAVVREGLGIPLAFFFAARGYATRRIGWEDLLDLKDVAAVALDSRNAPTEILERYLSQQTPGSPPLILLRNDRMHPVPAKTLPIHPASDFFQIQMKMDQIFSSLPPPPPS